MSLVRAVIRGTIASVQTWSTHIDFTQIGTGAVSQSALDTWLASFKTAVNTWWGAAGSMAANNDNTLVANQLVGYYYLTALSAPSLTSLQTLSLAGTSVASVNNDYRTAMCVSLLTNVPGRTNRGRIYLPVNRIALSSSHRFTSAQGSQMATAVANLIDAGNLIALGSNAVGAGPYNSTHPYQTVRVDDLPDTQRRRTNKLVPAVIGTAPI